MVRVDVYIEILSHSRSEGRAAYYYRLESMLKNGKLHTTEESGVYAWTTKNRAFLQTAVDALKRIRLTPEIEIVIHGDSDYFKRILNDIDRYHENDWKNKKGQEIKNADLWRLIYMQSQVHFIDVEVEQIRSGCYLQEVYENGIK